jgi:hypothetical protein
LAKIAERIAIHQVEVSNLITVLEAILANVVKLFGKLCDIPSFTQDIKNKLQKIDEDMKASATQLALDPSSNSLHLANIKYLTDL